MNRWTQRQLIDGIVGKIEIAIDFPDEVREQNVKPKGTAFVAHPHPLFGGTMENKVVHILAKTLVQLGYVVFRANFRGVGQTQGTHDDGVGETEDVLRVLEFMRSQLPKEVQSLVLAGFSFGTFVLSRVLNRMPPMGWQIEKSIFVGTATSRWQVEAVPENTLVIHGECDETIPIESVYRWAELHELPVTVVPGATHFFHGRLLIMKKIIMQAWSAI